MVNYAFNKVFTLVMLQLAVARSLALQSSCLLPSRRSFCRRNGRTAVTIRRSMSDQSDSAETSIAEYRNKNNIRDQVFSAMSEDGSIKVTACTARNLVNDLMIMHTMTATPADALGRAVACALLMSNGMQDEQVFQLTLNSKNSKQSALCCQYFCPCDSNRRSSMIQPMDHCEESSPLRQARVKVSSFCECNR